MREVVWQLSSNVVVAQSHYQHLVTPFQRQDAYICAHLLIFTFPHEQVSLKWSYERADNDLEFLSHSPSDLYGLLVVSATDVPMVRRRSDGSFRRSDRSFRRSDVRSVRSDVPMVRRHSDVPMVRRCSTDVPMVRHRWWFRWS